MATLTMMMSGATGSTSTECPPAVLYGARWIFFKTVMEEWMRADRPGGIRSLMQSIIEWTSDKIKEINESPAGAFEDAISYTVIKERSQNTLLSFVNFLEPQLNWIETKFQAVLGEPTTNIALDPLQLVPFAKSVRGVASQFTQMIDLQVSFLKKIRIDNFPLDGFNEVTPDQMHLVTWANDVLFDIDQITPYIAAHLNEIQMFVDDMALTAILNS